MSYPTLLERHAQRVNPRLPRPHSPAHHHPHHAQRDERQRDQLRVRQAHDEPVVLGAHELDDEPLDSRQHAVQSEQPALGVLVIAEAPEDEEHHEAERHLVELSRIHREHRCWARAGGHGSAELLRHDSRRRRRRALGKCDGEEAVPRTAVVVAHRPAAGAAHRIRRRARRRADVEDAHERKLLLHRDRHHRQHAADQAAPEHEAAALEHRVPVPPSTTT